MEISVKRLRESAKMPTFGTDQAAGADLYACLDRDVELSPGQTAFIPTGLSMAIPEGYVGLVFARSGLACKSDLAPANKVGVIDSDYRGEFLVALHNHGSQIRTVSGGERIAQLLIVPVAHPCYREAETLPETQRGTGGFGSTGK